MDAFLKRQLMASAKILSSIHKCVNINFWGVLKFKIGTRVLGLSSLSFRSLSPEVEEGICQVLSHMWLESEVLAGSNNNVPSSSSSSEASSSSSSKKAGRSQFEKKLGEFFMHQIAMDSSTAYGEGFRAGNLAMVKYGLRSTLDHIRLTGNFPV
eukprot:Gb_39736 [translate_table: standard]